MPIVEPEVLMDGDHSIERSEAVTREVLRAVFSEQLDQRVLLEGMVLKPNMIMAGDDCRQQAGVDEVAQRTLALLRNVSAAPAAFARRVRCTGEARAGRYSAALEKELAPA